MTQLPESAFWLATTYASGFNLARVKTIVATWCLEEEQPLSALFELLPARIADRFGLSAEEVGRLVAAAERVPEQAAWLAQLEGDGVQLITRSDPRYPVSLVRSLPLAMQPLFLFCRGDAAMLGRLSVAVIGAGDANTEAVTFARELATLLAEEGLVVVGGLGRGVGRAAFDGALSAEGGQTLAVLPMGISAFGAVHEVASSVGRSQALLVSPFHPEAKFDEVRAVARNRLIVGLASALFVVVVGEAGVARETADEALRLGRPVYVWDLDPGLEPAAAGNRALIKAGALPIAGVSDILDAVEAVVETVLDMAEDMEAPVPSPPPVIQAEAQEAETPFDPQAALELLSQTGRVPEALARRLRETE